MPESKKDQESVWDKAAKAILEVQAQSRFTRAPITIRNSDAVFLNLIKNLEAGGSKVKIEGANMPKNTDTTGRYYPNTNEIKVNLHGQQPTYQDLQNTIYHEDIHALLNQAGVPQPVVPEQVWYKNLMFGDPGVNALESWERANRAGNAAAEIPAYVGAMNPKYMQNFSEGDRQRYLQQLMPTLPDKTAQMFQRLLNSFQASQQPLPAQAPPLR